ncbi:hypothetical protein LCGC14_1234860 [marine sediment metagenome]|uniref:Phage gp6-like head-tail connector protein n=1 Tax=marine sediment metagenome TaxID=412755 RepID=A0A0F9L7F0_9ZZZZ
MWPYSALTLVTGPDAEPLDLNKRVKPHLRLETTDTGQDDYLRFLIGAARRWAEHRTRRAFITQTWKLQYDAFPSVILVPFPPYQSTTSLKYIKSDDGVLTSLVEDTDFTVDGDSIPARVYPAFEEIWPDTRGVRNAVELQYKCGYGDAATDVPDDISMAMLFVIAHWHENREEVATGPRARVPLAASSLLANYRANLFGYGSGA